MAGLLVVDTNLLVRLFTTDSAKQTASAVRLIEQSGKDGISLVVSDLVFAETLWVLTKAYTHPKVQVVQAARALLGDVRFTFERYERLTEAVGLFAEHTVDFTEAYAAAMGNELGARGVVSFDRDLRHLPVAWIEPK